MIDLKKENITCIAGIKVIQGTNVRNSAREEVTGEATKKLLDRVRVHGAAKNCWCLSLTFAGQAERKSSKELSEELFVSRRYFKSSVC